MEIRQEKLIGGLLLPNKARSGLQQEFKKRRVL